MGAIIFANQSGQTLITRTNLMVVTSFSFPELDQAFNALVRATRVVPRPVINVQGTIGGVNYLNVFGEDPMQVEIQGLIAGSACGNAGQVASGLANGVAFYSQFGVVNNVTPIRYRIQGQKQKQAFLVAMAISQDNSFVDLAEFQMTLLSEGLDYRTVANPSNLIGTQREAVITSQNTGLTNQINNSAMLVQTSYQTAGLLVSGETATPQTLPILE